MKHTPFYLKAKRFVFPPFDHFASEGGDGVDRLLTQKTVEYLKLTVSFARCGLMIDITRVPIRTGLDFSQGIWNRLEKSENFRQMQFVIFGDI